MLPPLLICVLCAPLAGVWALEPSLLLTTATQGDSLLFTVTGRTQGYIGLGLSLDGSPASSDIVFVWVEDSTQQGRIVDAHGVEDGISPVEDTTQNYKLIEASQNDTHTKVTFSRPWDTCDRKGDIVILNDTMRVVWTVSERDPGRSGWGRIEWRGPRSVHVGSAALARPSHHRALTWDVLAQDFTLPGDSPSFYWCKIYKVPSLVKKHHIIGYTPVLESGHEALIEHMVLYECLGGPEFEVYGSHPGAPCHDPQAPVHWKACSTPVVAWASGSKGEFLPEHIGFPMAEGEGKATYFMLEIHYDNPALQRVRDNSGLSLHYSTELRWYDSSILVAGITPASVQIIPPKQPTFTNRGYCDNQCTNLMFPETGIKIVSVGFHTHSAGRQVRLRHVREGKELQVIAQDKYFDPGYQQSKRLPVEITVLPGDDLITECSYNTANRSRPTLGGHAVKEETCMAYVLYYPRTALASCTSMTPVDFFFETFGVKKFYNLDMEEIEKILLKQTEKPTSKPARTPMQSLFFRFSEKEGFNIEVGKPSMSILKAMADISLEAGGNGEEETVFSHLVIEKPDEFQNKSFMSHLRDLPWQERLFTQRVEEILNEGKYRTFCQLQDNTPAMPSGVYNFPNITSQEDTKPPVSVCRRERDFSPTDNKGSALTTSYCLLSAIIVCYFLVCS